MDKYREQDKCGQGGFETWEGPMLTQSTKLRTVPPNPHPSPWQRPPELKASSQQGMNTGPTAAPGGLAAGAFGPWKEVRFSKADLFGLHQFNVPWMEDREFLMRLRTHENKSKLPITSNCNHLIRSPTSITSLQLNHQLQTPN